MWMLSIDVWYLWIRTICEYCDFATIYLHINNNYAKWPHIFLEFYIYIEGASIVKYITPISCKGLSERNSKIYTNFEFYEGKKT